MAGQKASMYNPSSTEGNTSVVRKLKELLSLKYILAFFQYLPSASPLKCSQCVSAARSDRSLFTSLVMEVHMLHIAFQSHSQSSKLQLTNVISMHHV